MAAIREFVQVLRTMIGVPDYDRYVLHMQHRHPGCPLLTRDEFIRARQDARYTRPGSRCC